MLSISTSDWSLTRHVYWEPSNSLPPVDDPRELYQAAEALMAPQEAQKTTSASAFSSANGDGVSLSLSQEARSAISSGSMQLSVSSESSTGSNPTQNLTIQMSGEASFTPTVIGFAQDGSIQIYQGGSVSEAYQASATISADGSSLQMATSMNTAELVTNGEVLQLNSATYDSSLNLQVSSGQSSSQQAGSGR